MIAMFGNDLQNKQIKYTHCELHPSLILGTQANTIPFPQHNPSLEIHIQVLKENKLSVFMLQIIEIDMIQK